MRKRGLVALLFFSFVCKLGVLLCLLFLLVSLVGCSIEVLPGIFCAFLACLYKSTGKDIAVTTTSASALVQCFG